MVEPPTAVVEDPPVKRVLAYPIELQYSDVHRPKVLAPSPPPSDGGDDDDNDPARRRRRVRPPSRPPSSGPTGRDASCHGGSRRGSIMKQVESSVRGRSHVAHSQAACSQPLAAGSKEVQVHDIPGDGRSAPNTKTRSPEDVPVPDAAAATNAVVFQTADVACIQETSPFPSVASPTIVRFEVDAGPLPSDGVLISGPADAASLGLDLGPRPVIYSQLACTRLGEATVWSSLGRPMVSCSSLSLPVGLAMVEASPASPRSPQRSPAFVFPGFFPPAPNPPRQHLARDLSLVGF